MKKQTAVEWLVEQIDPNLLVTVKVRLAVQQAKAMEKEQIRDAFEEGKNKMEEFHDEVPDEDECFYLMDGREYYNETFNK